MAEVDINPSFGAELKDGFKTVNAWVGNGILWLDDIQQFYRERSVIEKEYAGKLSALAKKYFEKKARKSSSMSVGDTPTVTPGSLESASMTTWTVQLTTLEQRAAEHDRFSTQLVGHVADVLKALQMRYEDLRKAHTEYAAKLEKERDASYADLRKTKGKYDSVCQEVENRRKKTDSAFDYGKSKATVAFQQQQAEMHNVKNTYIININVTNRQKERYYNEYVPELLDSMQGLSETRVAKLNSIWSLAARIEHEVMTRSTSYLDHLSSEIPRNNPALDSMMFVRHNAAPWAEPGDAVFEPSPVWHDDSSIMTDETAKNFLRNVLTKSKGQLSDLRRDIDRQKREIEGARRVRSNIREGKDNRDEVEVVRAIFTLQENLHEVQRQLVTAETEITTITNVVGDVSIGARNHDFKGETFKIPTNCDFCGERIWGLSAKGFTCRDCGFTCHSKCQMKAPADCPGEQSKEDKKRLKTERQEAAHVLDGSRTNGSVSASPSVPELPGNMPGVSRTGTVTSLNTLSSGYSAQGQRSVSTSSVVPEMEGDTPASSMVEKDSTVKASKPAAGRRRILAPPPTAYAGDSGGDGASDRQQKGKMMYAYVANGEGEISVQEGDPVVLVGPDDGSGWTKIKCNLSTGLVPTSYIDLHPQPPSAVSAMLAAPERPGSAYSNSSASLTSSAPAAKKKGPVVAPRRGAKKLKYAEALYDYESRSEAEHSIAEGERFVLISKDSGDGWADVEKGGVVKSVPANYIQEM
ncbi:FCH-domain-containing protein [Eremomyces bilateralis CBS 781.70]|uniref:Protein BZZ1 n=1 Tax=Eremomyces bilateralis CBS 781.70 TaxID=1392243 RepID=A0A6G1GB57_9PEZI|nr:FCH-domain-containing protein [Eremomyces bilateralis CBS 781.70]KAF1815305.1 FCH-domain-containing protein [Eremomyces bilateralis CBS 781.70]